MKIYEKPQLMVLSISANDPLCSCLHPSLTLTGDLLTLKDFDTNGDNVLSEGELAPFSFSQSETQCTGSALNVTGYCKFTGATMIFSS